MLKDQCEQVVCCPIGSSYSLHLDLESCEQAQDVFNSEALRQISSSDNYKGTSGYSSTKYDEEIYDQQAGIVICVMSFLFIAGVGYLLRRRTIRQI
jgi:hypothetical protein